MTSRFIMPFADVGSGINPSSGALLYFFELDGVTPKDTYTTKAATVENANPVVSNAVGLFPAIYIKGNYLVTLKDENLSQIFGLAPISEFLTTTESAFIKNFDTLIGGVSATSVIENTNLVDGDSVRYTDRTTGNDGGSSGKIVLSNTVTENGIDIIQCTGVPTLSFVLDIDKTVTLSALGGTGLTDDTAVLKRAFALEVKIIGDPNIEYLWTDITLYTVNTWVYGDDIRIKFTNGVAGHAIRFLGSSTYLKRFGCNGDYNSFCDNNGWYPAPVFFGSPETRLINPTAENMLGIQDLFQYAFHIDQFKNSTIQDPIFNDIKVPTATGGASGFCGAVFYTNDASATTTDIARGKHHIYGGVYSDIWTTRNPALEQASDSDAIRTFTHGYSGMSASEQTQIKETKLTVDGGYFFNVRKSAIKAAFIDTTFNNGVFVITDTGFQTIIAAAARCQIGSRFEVNNFRVSGLLIAVGVIAGAEDNVINDLHFDSTYSDSTALTAGFSGSTGAVISATNLFLYEVNQAVDVTDSKEVFVDGIYDMTDTSIKTSICRYIGTAPKQININKVRSKSNAVLLSGLNASSVFTDITFSDIKMPTNDSLSGLMDTRTAANSVTIKDSNISGGYSSFISTALVDKFTASNLDMLITGAANTMFDISSASLIKFNADIVDSRVAVSPIVIKLNATKIEVDLSIDATDATSAAAYSFPLFMNGTGTLPKIVVNNYEAIGFDTNQKSLEVQSVNHADFHNVDMQYDGGAISLFNSGNSLVRVIKGSSLAVTPVVQGGTGAQTTITAFNY